MHIPSYLWYFTIGLVVLLSFKLDRNHFEMSLWHFMETYSMVFWQYSNANATTVKVKIQNKNGVTNLVRPISFYIAWLPFQVNQANNAASVV